jgi:chemotaxis protein MotB
LPKLNLPEDIAPRVEVRIRYSSDRRSSGAWKVAYADLVTALMALFIVLWLMSASQKMKSSITGYFRDPRAYARAMASRTAANPAGGFIAHRDNMDEIRKQLEQALTAMPEFAQLRDHVQFSVTGEGLRIDLLENGRNLLRVLATETAQLPNFLVIEGHTDARPFRNAGPATGYSNWELATDRANAARRLLHAYGVRPEQVVEVRGYADQQPFNPKDLYDARNRRISVVIRFTA